MKLRWFVVVLALIAAACGGDDGTDTTVSSSATSAITTLPQVTTSTTTPPTTTSGGPVATTAAPATTTSLPMRPVTSHPNLPAALSGSEVPWDEVGTGWYLGLYSANMTDEPFTEGPTVLYLVDLTGRRFEVTSWDATAAPFELADWRPDGLAAAVTVYSFEDNLYEVVEVDLRTGAEQTLVVANSDDYFGGFSGPVEYTRPTGKNLVVYRNDGATETIERIDRSGATLAEVASKPYGDWDAALSWLYGYDGTEIIVGGDSLTRVGIDGTILNEMWSPPGERCVPVRWWDSELVLAQCHGDVPSLPHEYYSVLWTIPRAGGIGEAIIEVPAGDIANVYFGYSDAIPWSDPLFLEAGGDCSAGWVEFRGDDGLGYRLPGPEWEHGLLAVLPDGLVLNTWRDCDRSRGELILTDRDGNRVEDLIPLIGNGSGVVDVAAL